MIFFSHLIFIFVFSFSSLFCSNLQILQISIPKCGTNLLREVIKNIIKVKYNKVPADLFSNKGIFFDESQLRKKSPFINCIVHAIYCDYNVEIINKNPDAKIVFMYRDPRDQAVSAAYHCKGNAKIWPRHAHDSIESLISQFIYHKDIYLERIQWQRKLFPNDLSLPEPKGINDFYEMFLPWIDQENIYVTTFERLVGPKGGGDFDVQINEIVHLARYLGIDLSWSEAEKVARNSYGKVGTFRKGLIGSWKSHFNKELIEKFKVYGGELLIRLGYEKDFNW